MKTEWISTLPLYEHCKKMCVNNLEMIGKSYTFKYGENTDSIKVLKYDNKSRTFEIQYHDKKSTIHATSLRKCKLNQLVGIYSPTKLIVGLNDIPTTDPWMISYFQGGIKEARKYSYGSQKKIYPICPDCGRIKNQSIRINDIYKNHSISCSCSDGRSYPNKFMYSLLTQLNYEFIDEFSPDWIKPKRYDFYIPSRNLIIEMDGRLGHGKVIYPKSNLTIEGSLDIDNYKDKMAENHNIKVIRINSDISEVKYISENIINSGIFSDKEINNVSFEKCDKFATSNLARYVCEYYSKQEYATSKSVAKDIHMSQTATLKYLKQGNKFGWCKYNANEKRSIGFNKMIQDRYYTGDYTCITYDLDKNMIGRYFTTTEAANDLTNRLGINMCQSNISNAIKKASHKYNNFLFFSSEYNASEFFKSSIYKKTVRKIYCYDVNGNFIKQYNNVREIVEELNITNSVVYGILNRKENVAKTIHGYIFRYSDDCDDVRDGSMTINNNYKKIVQFDKNMNKLKEYNSVKIGSKKTGINSSSISQCLRNKSKTAGGYIWRYADEVENNKVKSMISKNAVSKSA